MPGHDSVLGIVGLGSMGESLLRMLVEAGYDVIGVDSDAAALSRVDGRLESRGKLPAGSHLTLTQDLATLDRADLVFEALPERFSEKVELLRRLDQICRTTVPIVSTSSSLSLSALAISAGRPASVVALRTLVPLASGQAVVIEGTPMTFREHLVPVEKLISGLGLTPVESNPAAAQHAVALVFAYLNHAVSLYDQGWASRDDIDTAMSLGCGQPLGPLALLDRIGLDSVMDVLLDRQARSGDGFFQPASLLKTMIAEGRFGQKAGSGFYEYDGDGRRICAPPRSSDPKSAEGIQRIAVIGSGTMARGIAEVAITAGFLTVLVARDRNKADEAVAAIENSLIRSVRKGRTTPAAMDAALVLLGAEADVMMVRDCDLIIEAVVEDLDVKCAIFAALGAVCGPKAVLATTTSSLSVTACAEASGRPDRVVGMHFFNPAPAMKLIELTRIQATRPDVGDAAQAVCERMGKRTVKCVDRTGFIVNYLLFPYLARALDLLNRQNAGADLIDDAVRHGFGFPMGPFTLLDTIGLDVSLSIMRELHEEFREPEFLPSPLLEQLVAAECLGRKNGRGLRSYAPRANGKE